LDGGSARRKATTYTGQHNTEKRGHTSMPRAGFEPTITVFERSKSIRASDSAATRTVSFLTLKLKLTDRRTDRQASVPKWTRNWGG